MNVDARHEFFQALEDFDPQWQTKYRNLETAARAAGVLVHGLYRNWLGTEAGERYLATMTGVKDSIAEQEAYARSLERARELL